MTMNRRSEGDAEVTASPDGRGSGSDRRVPMRTARPPRTLQRNERTLGGPFVHENHVNRYREKV